MQHRVPTKIQAKLFHASVVDEYRFVALAESRMGLVTALKEHCGMVADSLYGALEATVLVAAWEDAKLRIATDIEV